MEAPVSSDTSSSLVGEGKARNKMTLSSGPQGRFVVFLPIAVLPVSSPVEEEIMVVKSESDV